MFKNYLMTALRNINRQKMYSALNIAGLAVGLAAFILIALYVQNELSFDRYHENSDRIYRVVRDGRTLTPPPLGQALEATGGTALIAGGLLNFAEGYGPVVILTLLMIVTMTLSDVLNNTATAVIAAPIAFDIAQRLTG